MPKQPKISKNMLRPADVLLGRGKAVQNYKGNVAFRAAVKERCREYQAQNCIQRDVTCHDIIQFVQSRDGRFLERLKRDEEHWVHCSYPTMRLKVRQSMRDSLKGGAAKGNIPNGRNSIELEEGPQQPTCSRNNDRSRDHTAVHDCSHTTSTVDADQLERFLQGGLNDPRPTESSSLIECEQPNVRVSPRRVRSRPVKEAITEIDGELKHCDREMCILEPSSTNHNRIAGIEVDPAAAAHLLEFQGDRNVAPLSEQPSSYLRSWPVEPRSLRTEPDNPLLCYGLHPSTQPLSGVPSVQMMSQPSLQQQQPFLWREIRAPAATSWADPPDNAYLNYLLQQRRELRNALAAFNSSNNWLGRN